MDISSSPQQFEHYFNDTQCIPTPESYINVEPLQNNCSSPSSVSSKVHILRSFSCVSNATYICDSCLNYPSSSKTRHCPHTPSLQLTHDDQMSPNLLKSTNPNVRDDTIPNPKNSQHNASTAFILPGTGCDDAQYCVTNYRSPDYPRNTNSCNASVPEKIRKTTILKLNPSTFEIGTHTVCSAHTLKYLQSFEILELDSVYYDGHSLFSFTIKPKKEVETTRTQSAK
ncbi:hypothetical protein DPMN_112816 [Dreissena polymorpha]|uniref:Uncharacterized protein n=1 Tax=Dreissena polymorpha TaxID=45954 RepID=A0A9D4QR02_DREPO|nr:hypothetical protein DPMN_112816 [Dreissena polymorpha]